MCKRGFISLAIAVMIATTFVAQVSAQGQDRPQGQEQGQGRRPGGFGFGRGGPGGFGLAGLLRIEKVQKEIELLEEQKAELEKFGESLRAEFRPQDGQPQRDFRDLSEEEQRKAREEGMARMREINKKFEAKLAEVLLPHQLERVKQLEIQQQGSGALTNNESVIAALAFTDEQKAKIEAIQQANRAKQDANGEKFRALFQEGQEGDREANRAKFEELRKAGEELRKAADAELLAVLTDEQKKKLEELKGEPFEFPPLNFGGGRGGPGGPGGDRRRDGDNDRPQRPDA